MADISLGREISKTTWGSGGPALRKAPESSDTLQGSTDALGANGGDIAVPAAKKGKRAQPAKAAIEAPAAPPPPPEEETGLSLLSRLLGKSSDSQPQAPPTETSSFSSFQALSGSDDIFSFLKRDSSVSDTPYNALDFGAPPSLAMDSSNVAGVSIDAVLEDTAARGRGGRGRGRGRARAAGGGDDMKPEEGQGVCAENASAEAVPGGDADQASMQAAEELGGPDVAEGGSANDEGRGRGAGRGRGRGRGKRSTEVSDAGDAEPSNADDKVVASDESIENGATANQGTKQPKRRKAAA